MLKKNKKKSIIDTYSTIYNVDIVVANKYTTIKQINKLYRPVEGDVFEDSDCIAFTDIGYNRKTNAPVIIVKYVHSRSVVGVDKKIDLINTCAHEAVHVCMTIYSKIGEGVYKDDSNELLAYLVGWVTECIYKTWTK